MIIDYNFYQYNLTIKRWKKLTFEIRTFQDLFLLVATSNQTLTLAVSLIILNSFQSICKDINSPCRNTRLKSMKYYFVRISVCFSTLMYYTEFPKIQPNTGSNHISMNCQYTHRKQHLLGYLKYTKRAANPLGPQACPSVHFAVV